MCQEAPRLSCLTMDGVTLPFPLVLITGTECTPTIQWLEPFCPTLEYKIKFNETVQLRSSTVLINSNQVQ